MMKEALLNTKHRHYRLPGEQQQLQQPILIIWWRQSFLQP
jgi:hypothetical protein